MTTVPFCDTSVRPDASDLWLGRSHLGCGFLDTMPWCCSSVLIATVVSYVHNAPLMWNAESLRPSVGMSRGLSHSSTGNSSCCTTCTLLSCTKHITVKLSLSAPEPINTESAAGLVVFMISRRLYVVRNPQWGPSHTLGLEELTVSSIHSHRHAHRLYVIV